MTRIDELMTRDVRCCGPRDCLDAAAYGMWEADCGCLPVVDSDGAGQLVGIVTDRDVCMAALFTGKPLFEIRVEDVMSRDVRSCSPDDPPEEAQAIMQEWQLRRLPVVDAGGRLVGLVSLADLARIAGQRRNKKTPVAKATLADTLAAICEPTPREPGQRPAEVPEESRSEAWLGEGRGSTSP